MGMDRRHARTLSIRAAALLCLALVAAGCAAPSLTAGGAPRAPYPTATTARAPATPTAPPVPFDSARARPNREVDAYLASMSLDEKLGQMLLVETIYTSYSPDVDTMIRQLHAGAIIIYAQNQRTPDQLKSYIAAMRANAAIPLMVSADEEGGVVDRLKDFLGPRPSAQDLAATNDPQAARSAGARDARDLLAFGINTDLAPVVDVRTTPDAVEWTRLFGNDVGTVDTYAGAFLQGLQQQRVIGCLKHWPGIGGVVDDPHQTLPTITTSRAALEATEFAPFRNLLALDPGMIMVTHVLVPAIDPALPATLSPALVQGVLRGELGYDGVVMTDSLYMKGISLRYSLGEAAVLSVLAGDDLLEGAWDAYSMREMLGALKAAIAAGRITPARIDKSVRRILLLKQRYGLLPPGGAWSAIGGSDALTGAPLAVGAALPRA
ncbi:MAG TPA: glycoside hydrolase family 3 N-terminal domain-containing protein [Ktedonobacterales bacterium]